MIAAKFPSLIPTPAFEAYGDREHVRCGDYVAQNQDFFTASTDVCSTEPLSQPFATFDPHTSSVADLLPPPPNAQSSDQTLRGSSDAPILEGLYDLPGIWEDPLQLLPNNLNSIGTEWFCFEETWPMNEIRESALIAPTPTTLQSVTTSPTLPQPVSLSGLPPPLPKRKRKPFCQKGREKVKTVRRLGACYRCKIYKLTVGAAHI